MQIFIDILVIFVITFGTISPVGIARFASTESVVSSSMTSGESSKSSASWLCEDALSFFCSTGDEDANFTPSLRTDSARPSFLDKSNGCSYIVWLAGLEANGTRGGIFDSRRSLAREFWNQTWTWNNNLFKNTLWIFHNYKVYEFLFPFWDNCFSFYVDDIDINFPRRKGKKIQIQNNIFEWCYRYMINSYIHAIKIFTILSSN